MSDTEMILLPRSRVRVVLLRDEEDDSWDVKLLESREYLAYHRDRDEAIRQADTEAQALLGQLLPADARERIARALFEDDAERKSGRGRFPGPWGTLPVLHQDDYRVKADAILRALRGEVKS